ncbi:hypothetical protein O3P69_009272 [Scylla paramamosain]|uniref:Fork-head domain-containing protein n=1 Tax=Scylla paramamosain TaxID=85552 RepID=A0AAW0TCG2_SCYPA
MCSTLELKRPPSQESVREAPQAPQTYVELIGEALESSPSGALTLGGISEYLRGKYTFFRGPYQGWRNSVRHNLSLNQVLFQKVLRDPRRPYAKDNLWTLDPRHLPLPLPPGAPPTTHRESSSDPGRLLGVLLGVTPQALFALWPPVPKVAVPPVPPRQVRGFTVEDILRRPPSSLPQGQSGRGG